jgi:uncharacterized protein DUF2846
MNIRTILLAGAMLASLGACATGPTFSDMQTAIQPIPQGQGRVYFYRTQTIVGIANQPTIYMDDESVGTCNPGGVSYRDVDAGRHVIETTIQEHIKRVLNIEPNTETFIRCYMRFSGANLEVMNQREGAADIQSLSLTN